MSSTPSSVDHVQTLTFDFKVPKRTKTHVTVTVKPSDDPKNIGYHLIFPEKPIDYSHGFPVCTARVSSPHSAGYAAVYGWIQMNSPPFAITSTPIPCRSSDFAMDPLQPIFSELNTPFTWYGVEPTLFDAPSRDRREVRNYDWTTVSLLAYVEDVGSTRHVRPILAFEWGYWIVDGEVRVKRVKAFDAREAWEEQRGLMEGTYGKGGWTFGLVDEEGVEVEVREGA